MQESVTAMESAAAAPGSGAMHTAVRIWEGVKHMRISRENSTVPAVSISKAT
jgi:hypothetical protein